MRCLIKRKHKRFSEEMENINAGGGGVSNLKKTYQFSFAKKVNDNRLFAVLSKDFGRVTEENKDLVVDALAEDVWADFYLVDA